MNVLGSSRNIQSIIYIKNINFQQFTHCTKFTTLSNNKSTKSKEIKKEEALRRKPPLKKI